MDKEKIKNEINTRLMKFITNPEHLKENFENLDTYLEALRDSAGTKEDSSAFVDLQVYLAILFAIFALSKEQVKRDEEFNIKINSLTEKVVKLQNEFESMKKGK